MKIHIVQKGDTLWKIAKKYGVNFEELKKMNSQLSNPDLIMPGMKIKVPTGGGSIKKEAPISGGAPQAKINMGSKKEMPIAEHPFAKEKPKPIPEVEAPKQEEKKKAPVQEQPKKVKKEEAVKPYTPKMPKPVMPEIDIQNYYMMNMANMQKPAQTKPKLQPKPDNILPETKPVKPDVKSEAKQEVKPKAKSEVKPKAKSEIKSDIKIQKNDFMEESPSMMPFVQGSYQQPMIPYPHNCYPGVPAMPGSVYPGGQQMMPYPPVQGAMDFPGQYPGMIHGMGEMESSSYDQQMQKPLSPAMNENQPANKQQVSPEQTGPTYYGLPISPVMPGPGYCPPPGYPQQMPYMPQVGGMMENNMPQVGGMMDEESSDLMMPQMPNMPQVGGMMGNMPNMPQVGGMMGNMPNMPQVGGMMGNMPNMPQVGGMMGNMPNMPQVGGMMGNMPNMPQVGGMMGNMPNMPQVGGMMGNMPNMPQVGGMMGNMPNMPQVGGMMENMPNMQQVGGMMQPPMKPKQDVQGMDCGCGGQMWGQPMGNPYGWRAPGIQQHPMFGQQYFNPYAPIGSYQAGYDEESNEN